MQKTTLTAKHETTAQERSLCEACALRLRTAALRFSKKRSLTPCKNSVRVPRAKKRKASKMKANLETSLTLERENLLALV